MVDETGRRNRPPVLAEILFTAVVALIFLYWNPFNLWTRFDEGGRALLLNIFSVQYPAGRPRVAVVLAGDDFTEEWNYPWPLPLEAHGAILDGIEEQSPRAVFIDFIFIDRRETDSAIAEFANVIDRLSQTTEVYLAVAPQVSGADPDILAELKAVARLRENVHLVSVEIDIANQDEVLYPLGSRNGSDRAALAVARQAAPEKVAALEARRLRALDLFWPAPPPPENCAEVTVKRECASISPNAATRGFRLFLGGLFSVEIPEVHFPEAYRLHTYPVPTLRATDLTENGRASRHVLSDAYVFYGGDFRFTSNEAVETPIYGVQGRRTLPGVFSHAVAFDNIVSMKGSELIAGDLPYGLARRHFSALLVLAICLLAGFFWRVALVLPSEHVAKNRVLCFIRRRVGTYQFWLLPSYVLIVTGAFFVLHTTPGFWLTVLTVVSLRYTLPWLGTFKLK